MTTVAGRSLLEKLLIENASETLAGLKAASVFNVRADFRPEIDEEISRLNEVLNPKGVFVCRISENPKYTLILVYRRSLLGKALKNQEARQILKEFGYSECSSEACLQHLSERLTACGSFPHELGIFLGYPAADVREYIKNKGGGCRLCGFWKVYCNEQEALELFRKYRICNRIYRRAMNAGLSLSVLTVTA